MDDFTLRNVTEADAALLRKLAFICKPLDVHTPYTYWVITKLFSQTCYLLENGEKAIGFITAATTGGTCLIWQIGILPEFRRQKLSYRLIDAAVQKVLSLGIYEIRVTIDPQNHSSLQAFTDYCRNRRYRLCETGKIELTDFVEPDFAEHEVVYAIQVRQEQ